MALLVPVTTAVTIGARIRHPRQPPQHAGLRRPRRRVISVESPAAFRRSIRTLAADGLDGREKRALVLAQSRARAMLKPVEMREIASIRLPDVTQQAPAAALRRGRCTRG